MNLALKARLKCVSYVLAGTRTKNCLYLFRAYSARLINSPFPRAALPAKAGARLALAGCHHWRLRR